MGQRWGRTENFMVSPMRHPKTGIFWFRQAVPKAMQAAVAEVLGRSGKRHLELKWTLGTRDPAEARRRWPEALKRAQGIFEAAHSGAKPLTSEQLHALSGLFYHRQLALWKRDSEAIKDWNAWMDAVLDKDDPKLPAHYADDLLADEGIITDPDSRLRLSELLAQRLHRALLRQQQLDSGDYSPDPLPKTFPVWEPPAAKPIASAAPPAPGTALSMLCDRWEAIAAVKPRTAAETRYAIKALIAFLGHDAAGRLQRADLQQWRDKLKAGGLSNVTWNNRLSLIRQVLAFGVSEGDLEGDPTAGLRLPKGRSQSPLPYDDADAVKILLAARKEARPSVRWAHWIMAFTGMRAGEVLQLTGGDVRQQDGIWFLAVNEDTAGKSVKTGQRRNVPIHPALVKEGFLTFASQVEGDADQPPLSGPRQMSVEHEALGVEVSPLVQGRWLAGG